MTVSRFCHARQPERFYHEKKSFFFPITIHESRSSFCFAAAGERGADLVNGQVENEAQAAADMFARPVPFSYASSTGPGPLFTVAFRAARR
jgi:hypothetical protein